jgi:transcriptional regulator with XRE-family HTH domain
MRSWATVTYAARERLNLSQAEFALLLDIEGDAVARQVMVSRWENGHAVPARHYRERIAALYDGKVRCPHCAGTGWVKGTPMRLIHGTAIRCRPLRSCAAPSASVRVGVSSAATCKKAQRKGNPR